jgi:hypothetical protein
MSRDTISARGIIDLRRASLAHTTARGDASREKLQIPDKNERN